MVKMNTLHREQYGRKTFTDAEMASLVGGSVKVKSRRVGVKVSGALLTGMALYGWEGV